MASASYTVGVDTGGTFTDTVVVDADGGLTIGKQLSTPPEFVGGVEASLAAAAAEIGIPVDTLLGNTRLFLHGTTIVVNALVTGRGARIGLLTTRGFGDTVFIARTASRTAGLRSADLHRYAYLARPEPTIPVSKNLVREVVERVDRNGQVLVPLDEDSARRAVEELVAAGAEAIAICLLWSFMAPDHEHRLAEICREVAPEVPVTVSVDVARQMGEYERTTTAGFNAAMSSVAADYVDRLRHALDAKGLARSPLIMQGNGGVASIAKIREAPVNLVGSGPAGGVLGARALAAKLGIRNVICTDVGGTTFDVGLVVDGEPEITPTTTLHQHRLYLPLVDVVSIGAGGGSLARAEIVNGMPRLRVGPESAGARPGPVCYGLGGELPTVTDADLIVGMIDPEFFLGGQMALNVEAARAAVQTHVAEPLGMSVDEAAAGIIEIADNHMADLMRQVTVQRGHDPRIFTAFLYGGGGPLHGTAYAARLGLQNMVVPGGPLASVFSAWGIAAADIHHTFQRSLPMVLPGDPSVIDATFQELEQEARQRLAEDGIDPSDQLLQRRVEMHYTMQTNELVIPVSTGDFDDAAMAALSDSFDSEYERLYGRGTGFRDAGVEVTTCRVHAYGTISRLEIKSAAAEVQWRPATSSRSVYWPEIHRREQTPVYRRENVRTGDVIEGPAIIELPTTTVAVRPQQSLQADDMLNYFITQHEGEGATEHDDKS
jgi:N-methylhydantoinase A